MGLKVNSWQSVLMLQLKDTPKVSERTFKKFDECVFALDWNNLHSCFILEMKNQLRSSWEARCTLFFCRKFKVSVDQARRSQGDLYSSNEQPFYACALFCCIKFFIAQYSESNLFYFRLNALIFFSCIIDLSDVACLLHKIFSKAGYGPGVNNFGPSTFLVEEMIIEMLLHEFFRGNDMSVF